IKTTATEKESVQTLSRARALENTMSGEVSHMAIRLREASALATVAALCAVTHKAGGRPFQTVEQLLGELKQENLFPPGVDKGSQSGTLLSSNGVLYLRYRIEPLGIEVVSVASQKADGPSLIFRIPDDHQNGDEAAAVYIAEKLEGVVIPYSFAPSSEVIACGWERQKLPPAIMTER